MVYGSYWKFIKEHIKTLPLEDMDEDDFSSTATNFNIPYIGKLYTNYNKKVKYNNKLRYYKDNVKDKRD